MWDMRGWDVAELTASILPPLLTAKHHHTITTITAITPSQPSHHYHHHNHHTITIITAVTLSQSSPPSHHHHHHTITPSPPSHHHQPPSSMEEVCGGYSVLLSGWDRGTPHQSVQTRWWAQLLLVPLETPIRGVCERRDGKCNIRRKVDDAHISGATVGKAAADSLSRSVERGDEHFPLNN